MVATMLEVNDLRPDSIQVTRPASHGSRYEILANASFSQLPLPLHQRHSPAEAASKQPRRNGLALLDPPSHEPQQTRRVPLPYLYRHRHRCARPPRPSGSQVRTGCSGEGVCIRSSCGELEVRGRCNQGGGDGLCELQGPQGRCLHRQDCG